MQLSQIVHTQGSIKCIKCKRETTLPGRVLCSACYRKLQASRHEPKSNEEIIEAYKNA